MNDQQTTNEATCGGSALTAELGAGYCPHGCKDYGDCIGPMEWCQHTPAGCYPEEWGPSDNRRMTCACGNPDPAHMEKVPNAEVSRGAQAKAKTNDA